MYAYADLHIHSRFAIASSECMMPGALVEVCRIKGISVLGSGDAFHPGWQALWEEYPGDEVLVVPSAEVEDCHRVHHLILMEDFSSFSDLREIFARDSIDIMKSGRPHVRLTGGEIAAVVHDTGGYIGPAHAFTPWTSLYAYFEGVAGCYGREKIDFLELGLSADSSYGAPISELSQTPFLTNSDAHSPDPGKIGREFNCLDLSSWTVKGVLESIIRGRIVRNVGFFPEEGKYNRTACVRCFHHYTPEAAAGLGWRCPRDGGQIKKGVRDRARELADGPPQDRPPYLHMIPLGDIIAKVLQLSSPRTKKCQAIYTELIQAFGNEITTLIEAPPRDIRGIDPGVGDAIDALRNCRVGLVPGGGGRYGTFSFDRKSG